MTAAQIKMLVFDLDGTLVDSMGDFTQVASQVLARHFGTTPEQSIADYRRTSGLPFVQQVGVLYPGHKNTDQAVNEFETLKLRQYDLAPLFPDVSAVFKELKQRGIKIAVSSNNHEHNVNGKVASVGLELDAVLGYRDGFSKGREHFDFLKSCYNLEPGELFFVGDSLHDCKMAHASEVPFAARLGTFLKDDFARLGLPFHAISNLTELLNLV